MATLHLPLPQPKLGIIREAKYDQFTVIEIDRSKATWHHHILSEAGPYIKRKFENHLVISRPKERLKFVYR